MTSRWCAWLLAVAASLSAWSADLTDGEIRKVDKAANKLTIAHGEIKNLQMPAMTMVFAVKDVAWLDRLKAGDRVRFVADKTAAGYIVTAIQPAK